MKKEKIILSVSISCVALILCLVMFTQFKTIEQTDIVAIETMRETELRSELATWKEKYEEIETKLEDTNNKIQEYKTQMSSEENAAELLKQELTESQKFLGYTDIHGEGIVITLEDNDSDLENSMFRMIKESDLVSLVNELKNAGAEAISINDERVVNSTDIALINDRIILVNGRRISGPYVVKAIGDRKYLESAITIKGGYLDTIKADEKRIDYTIMDDLVINKYQGEMKLDYINVNKEEKK